MKNQFIPYTHAKMLKECGADIYCIKAYGNTSEKLYDEIGNIKTLTSRGFVPAPDWSQAEEWIWEILKLVISVSDISIHHEGYSDYEFEVTITDKDGCSVDYLDSFESPIIAKEKGILKAIEHIHSNKK